MGDLNISELTSAMYTHYCALFFVGDGIISDYRHYQKEKSMSGVWKLKGGITHCLSDTQISEPRSVGFGAVELVETVRERVREEVTCGWWKSL